MRFYHCGALAPLDLYTRSLPSSAEEKTYNLKKKASNKQSDTERFAEIYLPIVGKSHATHQ